MDFYKLIYVLFVVGILLLITGGIVIGVTISG